MFLLAVEPVNHHALGGVLSSDSVASVSQGQIPSLADPQTSEGEDAGHAGDSTSPGLASASSRRLNILVKAVKSALSDNVLG